MAATKSLRAASAGSDPSAEVVWLEDQLSRAEIQSVLATASLLPLAQGSSARLRDTEYVKRCLAQLHAEQQRTAGTAASTKFSAPKEELAYALQNLANHLSVPVRDRAIAADADPEVATPASAPADDCDDLIVAEDVIPHTTTAQSLYSRDDSSNRAGYERAHHESRQLAALEQRLAYAWQCLQSVKSKQEQEARMAAQASRQAGPADDQAWDFVAQARQATRKIRSKL